jgi:hypothetical protein
MCAMAKRINFLDLSVAPDLIILEFAVNDYQGQDHKVHLDHKTDVFFDGFQTLAVCAETVIYKLLTDFPNAAIVFLEFQTAVLNRKTAQLLHMGVAQHYQIPVVSYADTMWPDFYRLIDTLKPYNYSLPTDPSTVELIHAEFPYPHGCAPCQSEHIIQQFRDKGCKSICVFMERSGLFPLESSSSQKCDDNLDTQPCYVSFLAHDAVHPSVIGHRIARDLIANLIARVAFDSCQGQTFRPYHIPTHGGWLVAASTKDTSYGAELIARSNFVLVQDTMEVFAGQNPLLSKLHTKGFELKPDEMSRKGWIATNPSGGESITFVVDLPLGKCYAIFISVLKSYETVGVFSVTVEDTVQKTKTANVDIDCLWEPHISVPVDQQITADDHTECTGKCRVIIKTHPQIPVRRGNLVKIMSLSARECIIRSSGKSKSI